MPAARNLLADLRLAETIMTRERQTIIECHSRLEEKDGEHVPIPGTLDPEVAPEVADYERAIAAISDTVERLETTRMERKKARDHKSYKRRAGRAA